MRGRTPNKEERDWMDQASRLGCIVCKLYLECDTPAEIHHLDGKTKPMAHLKSIPLCFRHHREGANNDLYVSRHPYKHEFEDRYGTQEELLKQTKELINNG